MALNVGYLTSKRTKESDECMTPKYAVEPILEYIPKYAVVWCPFDKEDSNYVKMIRAKGNQVICSHIDDGKDFFEYEPEYYNMIISNPPFSLKDEILDRVYTLGKPFALLLPIQTLQGVKRFENFKKGCEVMCFDQRVGFGMNGDGENIIEGSPFASIYICRGVLPEKLMFKRLNKSIIL